MNLKKGIDFPGITTVFCCHDGKGNLLMCKRSENCRDEQGRWEFAGGSLEFGLSIKENLKKELMEEFGVKMLDCKYLGFREAFRKLDDGTKTHWISFDHLVLVDREKVIIGELESIDEIGWFNFDNLPSPFHSLLPAFVEKYRKIIEGI